MSFSSDVKTYLYTLYHEDKKYMRFLNYFEAGCVCADMAELLSVDCSQKIIGAYIAGVFYSFGTVSDPKKACQLFLIPPDEAFCRIMAVTEKFSPRAGVRAVGAVEKRTVYFKKADDIYDIFATIGATKYTLIMMNEEIERENRRVVNRTTNAVFANIDRAAAAASRQINAIKLLRENGLLNLLSDELIEAAELREANPDMNLSELCLLCKNPVTKSGFNHRLAKLIEAADKANK